MMKLRNHVFILLMLCFGYQSIAQEFLTQCPDKKGPCYEKERIVYSLNYLSNVFFGVVGNSQTFTNNVGIIQDVLNDQVTKAVIGDWEVVWGPALYFSDTDCVGAECVLDNLLVLYKNKDKGSLGPDYVLATSGTNDISRFGWFNEDFDVYSLVEWGAANVNDINQIVNIVNPSKTSTDYTKNSVSFGSATGLQKLLSMESGNEPIYQKLKTEFFKSRDKVELAVAGHSLGGALSPVLAMALKDYQAAWDPKSNVTITSWPTAGASPGTAAFKTHFFNKFKGNFFGRMNELDLVPHAWQYDSLGKIPQLYDHHGLIQSKLCLMDNLMQMVQDKIASVYGNNYVFSSLYSEADLIRSKFDPEVLPDIEAAALIADCGTCPRNSTEKRCQGFNIYRKIRGEVYCTEDCNGIAPTAQYLLQALHQHVARYNNYFEIKHIEEVVKSYKKSRGILHTKAPKELNEELLQALEDYIAALKQ